jgi:iron complex outermembrane receptor protein
MMSRIPDGSRDSLTRKFTRQIAEDGDAPRQIVPQSALNSYGIPTLHQHVQLYRIYNNSNFILGNGNLLVNLGYQLVTAANIRTLSMAILPGLNLHLTTYTYDVKYNFNIGNDYETTFGM